MTRTPRVWVPIVVVLLGVIAAWGLFVGGPTPETGAPQVQPPLVRVLATEPRTVQIRVDSQGAVQPATQSILAAEVAGEIISASLQPGGFFEKNDVLARIDPREYRLAITTARAELAQARLALKREEQEAAVARREWDELGRGEASALALHLPQLEQARAAVAAAAAALTKAKLDLSRTTLHAPYRGRVRARQVDVGQFVNRGAPLATIYAIAYVEVTLPIADEDAAFLDLPLVSRSRVTKGPRVILRANFAGREQQWTARIVRTEGEIDPQTRLLQAVARVDDPYAPDKPPLPVGLFVRAEILGRSLADAYVLPRAALRGENTVYVIGEENRLQFRQVRVVRRDTERVVIGAGLRPGDRVVLSNMDAPVEGMAVRTLSENSTTSPRIAEGAP